MQGGPVIAVVRRPDRTVVGLTGVGADEQPIVIAGAAKQIVVRIDHQARLAPAVALVDRHDAQALPADAHHDVHVAARSGATAAAGRAAPAAIVRTRATNAFAATAAAAPAVAR